MSSDWCLLASISYLLSRGPDGTKYRIRAGVSYGHGKIKCLCDVEDRSVTTHPLTLALQIETVPDNVCGVWIAGFSQKEFGKWEFAAKTSTEIEMRREENIEIIEFPCGEPPKKPHWEEKVSYPIYCSKSLVSLRRGPPQHRQLRLQLQLQLPQQQQQQPPPRLQLQWAS